MGVSGRSKPRPYEEKCRFPRETRDRLFSRKRDQDDSILHGGFPYEEKCGMTTLAEKLLVLL